MIYVGREQEKRSWLPAKMESYTKYKLQNKKIVTTPNPICINSNIEHLLWRCYSPKNQTKNRDSYSYCFWRQKVW